MPKSNRTKIASIVAVVSARVRGSVIYLKRRQSQSLMQTHFTQPVIALARGVAGALIGRGRRRRPTSRRRDRRDQRLVNKFLSQRGVRCVIQPGRSIGIIEDLVPARREPAQVRGEESPFLTRSLRTEDPRQLGGSREENARIDFTCGLSAPICPREVMRRITTAEEGDLGYGTDAVESSQHTYTRSHEYTLFFIRCNALFLNHASFCTCIKAFL